MQFTGQGGMGFIAKERVRPLLVVVPYPGGDHHANMLQAQEQRLIGQLVARATVKALDVAILHRLARGDIVLLPPNFPAPGEDGVRGQLGPVVADNHPRCAHCLTHFAPE